MREDVQIEQIMTFGDVRRTIVQVIADLRNGKMTPSLGMAIAANMKVLNDNVQTEINAAKITMQAKEKGLEFGQLVSMGQRRIGGS